MKYAPINNSLFILNRKNLVDELNPGSIAVFNSNDIQPTNADGTMVFRQNSDIFYLSGIDQEDRHVPAKLVAESHPCRRHEVQTTLVRKSNIALCPNLPCDG